MSFSEAADCKTLAGRGPQSFDFVPAERLAIKSLTPDLRFI